MTSNHEDMHGGELETSILRHVAPDMVRPGYEGDDWVADERTHLHLLGMAGYTRSGLIGRPSLADPEKGRLALVDLTRSFAAHLGHLHKR